MVIKGIAVRRSLAGIAAMAVGIAAGAGWADEVTLKSSDGTVDIVGDFVAFENNMYVIRTGLGDLRISAERVRCEGEDCPELDVTEADVTFAGSDTIGLGMMPLLLEGYGGFRDADVTVTSASEGELLANLVGEQGFGDPIGDFLVSSSGSGDAFTALADGTADIGMSSRRIRPDEARSLRDAGAGNMIAPTQEHIIAVDSLIVIVHPNNPIESLSVEQLADIYSGAITNWSELGGEDAPINVVGRAEDSGTRDVFEQVVFDGADVPLPDSAQVEPDNVAVSAAVNDDPTAIGFVSYAFQRGAKPLPIVNECGIVMEPNAFSARTEEYALERRLYMYNREDLSDDARAFLEFVGSEEADGVIAKAGFIDLGIAQRPQPVESARGQMLLNSDADPYEGGFMREMLSEMVDYDRLSTTFRFRTGSANLDERGELNMTRLVADLEGRPEGTRVLFVGFTDEVGAFDPNLGLSRERAAQVLRETDAFAGDRLGGIEMAATGYGEIAPSACNASEEGRQINRRVEVWIQEPEDA